MKYTTTIIAPATVPGTGAICVIRISGPRALEAADAILRSNRPLSSLKGYCSTFGSIYCPDGKLLDEVVATVFRAPHSYTGEDSVEISCHSSKYIVEQVLSLLLAQGCTLAGPGEFTQRAFLCGKMDLAQAEAVADLIGAQNAASHRLAMSQLKGGYSLELRSMREEMLRLASLMELELDFSEEDVEFADRQRLLSLVEDCAAHCEKLLHSFKAGNALKNGIPVAIIGAPNAGKSTLLNSLLGEERALVCDVAGTTRDTIEETLDIAGAAFRFIDTAGLHQTSDQVELLGIERTHRKLSEALVVIVLLDATTPNEAVGFVSSLSSSLSDEQMVIYALNKCDLLTSDDLNKIVTTLNIFVKSPILQLSAKNGLGLDDLKGQLSDFGSKLLPSEGQTVISNLRHAEELSQTLEALLQVRQQLNSSAPSDLVAEDLRCALTHLGSITGDFTPDEVLGNIFKNFCIGK